MLAKLTTLVKSKTALAILGVVLVGGSGGAVAMAATTGHLSPLGVNLNTSDQKTPDASETPDSHGHTVSVEGLLKACDTTSTPNTISVTDKSGKSWTFNITTGANGTKFNGDTETESTSKGDNSASAGGTSTGDHAGASTGDHAGASTGDHTGGASTGETSTGDHTGGTSTGESSTHVAPTLADVCASANLNTRDVEVQATPNGNQYDAWKVTLQGPDSGKNDGQSGASTDHTTGGSATGGSSTGGSEGTPEAKPTGTPGD